jgi:hypothetical protein
LYLSSCRCNVPHKPDLRTANYAPEFPPSVITAAAVFTVSTAAIFTVSTNTVSTASAAITAAVVYVTAAAFTIIAAAASIIAVTAAAVFIASIATAVYTAGSITVIPTSFCRCRLLHYRTADIVACHLQDHQFRRRRLCLRSSSASGPPVRDEDLTSEGTASVMADKGRATSDREKNDGNE